MRIASSKVHFIGIGGIGMCGIAEILLNMGAKVSGSDLVSSAQIERLKNLGAQVFLGHQSNHVEGADVVVFSSAVSGGNPEFQEARRRGIPLIKRAEALAELMRLKRGLAIAGTHGKTTTTSLAASAFLKAGVDPTICVGGRLDLIQSTAQLGLGDWFIAEADESDGSFARLSPEIVIVTNVDNDHLDHYGSFRNLQQAFFDFASLVPFYGVAIVCGDDAKTKELFADYSKKVLFYGFEEHNNYILKKSNSKWQVLSEGQSIGEFSLPMPGRHNALNALAALIAGLHAGLEFTKLAEGLASFRGVDRRFQWRGRFGEVDFYDDYGHHPTEIRAALQGMNEKYPDRRKVVVFQPHRFSRTQLLWNDFLGCFTDADHLFLLDIYPAGEKPIDGIHSRRLFEELSHPNKTCLAVEPRATTEAHRPSISDEEMQPLKLDDKFLSLLQKDDVVLALGAGHVNRLVEGWLMKLRAG